MSTPEPSQIIAPEYRKIFNFLFIAGGIIGALVMLMAAVDSRISAVSAKSFQPALDEQKMAIAAVRARLDDGERRLDRAEIAQQRMMDVLTEIRGDVKYLKEKAGAK